MAFLRSVSRCNPLVTRNISTQLPSYQARPGNVCLNIPTSKQLSCSLYYIDIRRELNTCSGNQANHHRSGPLAVRNVSSAAAKTAAAPTATPNVSARDPLDVSFNNPIAAFKSKTTWELVRAYLVYVMCSSEYLVENNMQVKDNVTFIVDINQNRNRYGLKMHDFCCICSLTSDTSFSSI